MKELRARPTPSSSALKQSSGQTMSRGASVSITIQPQRDTSPPVEENLDLDFDQQNLMQYIPTYEEYNTPDIKEFDQRAFDFFMEEVK